jgi:hypothetical protein
MEDVVNAVLLPKISKSLEWLRPYLDDVKKILPEVRLVTHVVAMRPKANNKDIQRIHAIISQNKDKTFKLSLMVSRKSILKLDPTEFKMLKYTKIEMLEYLAHELAHTRSWEHTPDRKILECRLAILFMRRLSRSGYISEEIELNKKLGDETSDVIRVN